MLKDVNTCCGCACQEVCRYQDYMTNVKRIIIDKFSEVFNDCSTDIPDINIAVGCTFKRGPY